MEETDPRCKYPPRINIAGKTMIHIEIDFVAESRAGIDEYLSELIDTLHKKATTRTIQEKHNVGVRNVEFDVPIWPARVSS